MLGTSLMFCPLGGLRVQATGRFGILADEVEDGQTGASQRTAVERPNMSARERRNVARQQRQAQSEEVQQQSALQEVSLAISALS